MTSREGRQLLERVLTHLNFEHATARNEYDWHAAVGASEICCHIIRNWNRPEWFWNRVTIARKAAA